jgi:hypothetical protein
MMALAEIVRGQLDRGEKVETTKGNSSIRVAMKIGGEIYQNDVSYQGTDKGPVEILSVKEVSMTFE